jgi:hypothetical protein
MNIEHFQFSLMVRGEGPTAMSKTARGCSSAGAACNSVQRSCHGDQNLSRAQKAAPCRASAISRRRVFAAGQYAKLLLRFENARTAVCAPRGS